MSRTVGTASMMPTGLWTLRGDDVLVGWWMINGTRTCDSSTYGPCLKYTSCSPRPSPWSAVSTTKVFANAD